MNYFSTENWNKWQIWMEKTPNSRTWSVRNMLVLDRSKRGTFLLRLSFRLSFRDSATLLRIASVSDRQTVSTRTSATCCVYRKTKLGRVYPDTKKTSTPSRRCDSARWRYNDLTSEWTFHPLKIRNTPINIHKAPDPSVTLHRHQWKHFILALRFHLTAFIIYHIFSLAHILHPFYIFYLLYFYWMFILNCRNKRHIYLYIYFFFLYFYLWWTFCFHAVKCFVLHFKCTKTNLNNLLE